MKIPDAYNRWSSTYDIDENLTRDLDQSITRDILADLHCKLVVEIGCGTGKNTALLATMGEKVHAFDISTGMIRRAKEKLRSSKVTFSVADITRPWPYVANCADLIVCNLVLEHIEKLDSVFSEVFRLLVAGGRFFISELHPFRQYEGTKARFKNNQEIIEIQAFVHHISDFLKASEVNGLRLRDFGEWWHEKDLPGLPRLVSFLFEK
jgi:ubiquinone/menaquinone biosynthesis C-methylase UbiE